MRKFVRTRSRGAPAADPLPAPLPAPLAAPPAASPHSTHNGVNGDVYKNGYRSIPRSHTPVSRLGADSWDGGGGSCGLGAGGGGYGGGGGKLWVDEEFQGWRALGDKKIPNVKWMRVTELSPYPRFFGDLRVRRGGGTTPADDDDDADSDEDIYDDCPGRWEWVPGPLGCVGALAAVGALCGSPRLLRRAAPPHDLRAAAGQLRFRLWDCLGWRWVQVDDRLPTRRGRLLGSRGAAPHDYTLALLEKALAKLAGSYAALRGAGWGAGGALRALSGGVLLAAPLSPAAAHTLLPATAPLATVILVHNEDYSSVGVVCGLARVRGGAVLVRLRALRGAGERAGGPAGGPAGAAGGALWRSLPPPDRELLAARLTHPHDCWLSLEEVCGVASRVALCALPPEQAGVARALRGRRAWRAWAARRAWRRGATAGGPPPHAAAAANPRFQLQLSRPALLLAAVAAGGVPAGVALYRLGADGAAARVPAAAREAAALWRLAPGRYVLVPHAPRHAPAPFLLRLLTDVPAEAWEMDEDNLLLRDISEDFLEDSQPVPPDLQKAAAKILGGPYVEEVPVAAAAAALQRAGAGPGAARALAALRATRAGCVRAADLPALAALVRAWAAVWHAAPLTHSCGRSRCSYGLRGCLRAAGVSASNRVLLAAAPATCRLRRDTLLQVLARIHLAHERFRRLDNSIKNNPITLEEMILMTLYS